MGNIQIYLHLPLPLGLLHVNYYANDMDIGQRVNDWFSDLGYRISQ